MNLPNGEHAVVEPDKVKDYLLDVAHPDGFGKAAFFTAMGFQREALEALAPSLATGCTGLSSDKKHDIRTRAEVYC
jgi:hypothetical protein